MVSVVYPTLLAARPQPGPLKSRSESDLISILSTEPGTVEIDIDCAASESTTRPTTPVESPGIASSHEDLEGVSAKLPAGETLIIFDFDDTLFPTTWLLQQGLLDGDIPLDPVQTALLLSLEESATRTLQIAMQYGKIVIVTNAIQGWVEHSSALFMPSLASLIQHFEIVSARSTYDSKDADTPTSWKKLAFAREVRLLCSDADGEADATCHRTIISLGDSLCEQQALVAAVGAFPNCSAKSLKFMEQPHIENLLDQHELVHGCFSDVYEHEGHLDLEVAAPQ